MFGIKNIKIFEELESTNDKAYSLAQQGAKSGTVIIAKRQTKGRGRLNRTWYSEDEQISLSAIFRENHLHKNFLLLPLYIAVSLIDSLRHLGVEAFIKWPNDIVVPALDEIEFNYCGKYRKIAGILIENLFTNNKLEASIVGIGINYKPNPQILSHIPHAGFLLDYLANKEKIATIYSTIIKNLFTNSYEDILKQYKNNCITLYQEVKINGITGRACDISENGELVIFDGDKNHLINVGEVALSQKTS